MAFVAIRLYHRHLNRFPASNDVQRQTKDIGEGRILLWSGSTILGWSWIGDPDWTARTVIWVPSHLDFNLESIRGDRIDVWFTGAFSCV
jgi:hypothetical protein